MIQLKRMVACCLVFLAGMVFMMQINWLRYGTPEHYNGGWGKLILALGLAVFFGSYAIRGE